MKDFWGWVFGGVVGLKDFFGAEGFGGFRGEDFGDFGVEGFRGGFWGCRILGWGFWGLMDLGEKILGFFWGFLGSQVDTVPERHVVLEDGVPFFEHDLVPAGAGLSCNQLLQVPDRVLGVAFHPDLLPQAVVTDDLDHGWETGKKNGKRGGMWGK